MNTVRSRGAPLVYALTAACLPLVPTRAAPESGQQASGSRHYTLAATPENVQWGWYDPKEKPRLTIHSGDTVSIETLSHSLGQGVHCMIPKSVFVHYRGARR